MQAQQSSPDKKTDPETFSFCVGRPFEKDWNNPNGTAICTYAYGAVVHHGTMAYAEEICQFANDQTGKKNLIYKLVQVSK